MSSEAEPVAVQERHGKICQLVVRDRLKPLGEKAASLTSTVLDVQLVVAANNAEKLLETFC